MSTLGFMPHGMCYLWQPNVLVAHVLADALIALAYFSIPTFLLWLVRKRRDLPFPGIVLLFAVFIVSCGVTHLLSIWVIWHPDYWLEAGAKWITAIASIATVIAVIPIAPRLLAYQSRAQALNALEESEARLQTFLRTVPQIVWTADAAGSIDWFNNEWFEYTGQSTEEALGFGWESALHPEDLMKAKTYWPDATRMGEQFEIEFRLRKRDGSFHWFLTRFMPQVDATETVIRWFGSTTDIDTQKSEAQRCSHIAQKLQEAFIPKHLPVRDDVRFDAVYVAAERDAAVGGDWYDAMTLPDGRILISCGDVTGHGIDAAVLAGRFRHSIAVAGVDNPDPASIFASVNRTATAYNEGIATAVVALFDPTSLHLTYAIAGHPPPAVALTPTVASLLPNGGLPLGVLEDASWTSHTLALREDSVVVFYTDGVTEYSHDIIGAEQTLIHAAASLVGDFESARPALAVRKMVIGSAMPVDDVVIVVLQCAPSTVGLVHA